MKSPHKSLLDVFDNSPNGVFVKDLSLKFVYVNSAVEKLLNKKRHDILGNGDAELVPNLEFVRVSEKDDLYVLRTGSAVAHDEDVIFGYDVPAHIRTAKFPILNESGEIRGILGIISELNMLANSPDAILDSVPNQSGLLDDAWGSYSLLQSYFSSQSYRFRGDSLNEILTAVVDLHEDFGPEQLTSDTIIKHIEVHSPSVHVIRKLHEKRIDLTELDWRLFEEVVTKLLEMDGYEVKLQQGRNDGGADILAWKDMHPVGRIFTVWQAKHLRKNKVGLRTVRELADTRQVFGASKGMIVTSSFLTRGALKRIERQMYTLGKVDKHDLLEWIDTI